MTKEEMQIKQYEIALKIQQNEDSLFWQTSNIFLIANTILGSVIAVVWDKNLGSNTFLLILCIIGFIVSLIWLLSYQKRTNYFQFRMAQVRESEPSSWNLLNGKGKKYSEGAEVLIDRPYRMPRPARFFTTHEIHLLLIILFLVVYFLGICYFLLLL
ncbi:MAG: hypothetical protein HYW63_02760 [Candidatus Levybacteria bacterium]|nr:hypothetical protein [Candidatus Levybacteria bacterium]